jgi:hypothetical protein
MFHKHLCNPVAPTWAQLMEKDLTRLQLVLPVKKISVEVCFLSYASETTFILGRLPATYRPLF